MFKKLEKSNFELSVLLHQGIHDPKCAVLTDEVFDLQTTCCSTTSILNYAMLPFLERKLRIGL